MRIARTRINAAFEQLGEAAQELAAQLIKPDDTIRSAAAVMKKLVGMITDRDIAIRGVAEVKDPTRKSVTQ